MQLKEPKALLKLSRHDFKSPQRVIFIAATDDKDWLKEAFAVKTEEFWADDVYFSADLFSSVGIKKPGAGEDLALLSLCDHSIVSVSFSKIWDSYQLSSTCQASTFGQWGALLAGGKVLKESEIYLNIVYCMPNFEQKWKWGVLFEW